MRNEKRLRRQGNDNDYISELNVVPYIDVMLVLLIIFMITAPMLQHSIEVDLPETSQSEQKVDTASEPIVLTVSIDGLYYLNTSTKPISLREITIKILAINKINKNVKSRVYIRGDKKASYSDVIKAISTLKKSGVRNIGLMSDSA